MHTHPLTHTPLHSHTLAHAPSHTHTLTLTLLHAHHCTHTHPYTHTLAHASSHTCTRTFTSTHSHTHPCTYTLLHARPLTPTHPCTYTLLHMHHPAHTSLHSHSYTRILSHTHRRTLAPTHSCTRIIPHTRAHPYTHTLAFVCSLLQLAHLLAHPHGCTHSHACIVSPVHTPFLSLTHSLDKHSHSNHLQSAVPRDTPLLRGSALTPDDLPQKSWEDHIPLLGDLVTAAVSPLFMGLWDEFLTCLLSQGELWKDSPAAATNPSFHAQRAQCGHMDGRMDGGSQTGWEGGKGQRQREAQTQKLGGGGCVKW